MGSLPPLASGCQKSTSRHRKAHLSTRGARGFPATSGIWVSRADQQAQEGSLEHQGGKGLPCHLWHLGVKSRPAGTGRLT